MADQAVVPVKSAWLSKIIWAQVLGAAVSLITTNAFGLDPETQARVVLAVQTAQSVATIIIKSYFTNTVTPGSV